MTSRRDEDAYKPHANLGAADLALQNTQKNLAKMKAAADKRKRETGKPSGPVPLAARFVPARARESLGERGADVWSPDANRDAEIDNDPKTKPAPAKPKGKFDPAAHLSCPVGKKKVARMGSWRCERLWDLVSNLRNTLREDGGPRKLRVFDFDDTLVSSSSSVSVHKGEETLKMDSATFAHFKPVAGDQLDFTDFNNVTKPRIIQKNFEEFKAHASDPDTDLVVLTARPKGSASAVSKFLEAQGVKGVQVVALASSDPHDKGRWIDAAIDSKGYQDVEFVDDSQANVDAVAEHGSQHAGVKFASRNVPHPKEPDYAGPPIPTTFASAAPTTARVAFNKPGAHTPEKWWEAQTDAFKKNYCSAHDRSKYCRGGAPL
jgi:hypothetical protein